MNGFISNVCKKVAYLLEILFYMCINFEELSINHQSYSKSTKSTHLNKSLWYVTPSDNYISKQIL